SKRIRASLTRSVTKTTLPVGLTANPKGCSKNGVGPLRARRPCAGQRAHRQLRRPLPEGRPAPGRGREADHAAPEGDRGPAGEGGAGPRPGAGGRWRSALRGLAARALRHGDAARLREGGHAGAARLARVGAGGRIAQSTLARREAAAHAIYDTG